MQGPHIRREVGAAMNSGRRGLGCGRDRLGPGVQPVYRILKSFNLN